jgi:hypothetical protein
MFRKGTFYFLFGAFLSCISILLFFGTNLIPNQIPKIKINIKPFIQDSRIILFNRHIHHWMFFLGVFFTSSFLFLFYKLQILNVIKGFSFILILHGLGYKDRFDLSTREFNIYKIKK